MRDPNKNEDLNKNEIDVDPGTLLLIVFALILLPLVLTGFFSQ